MFHTDKLSDIYAHTKPYGVNDAQRDFERNRIANGNPFRDTFTSTHSDTAGAPDPDGDRGAGAGVRDAAGHGEWWMAAVLSVAWPWIALGLAFGIPIGAALTVLYGGLKR